MQRKNGQLIYSPSDLIQFMESPFATWMQRLHVECPGKFNPDAKSEELQLIADAGTAHETQYLQSLQTEGRDVCVIERSDRAKEGTLEAIQCDRDVIFQALLEKDQFRGYADFLFKVSGATKSYEVCDTKLARSVKPYYLIQLCCYSEMLADLQGHFPEHVKVVLGTKEIKQFRTENFFNYYLQLKKAFLGLMADFDPAKEPPLPSARADHRCWQSYADKILLECDHLSQIAGITIAQIKKLNEAGVQTVAQLAASKNLSVSRIPNSNVGRLIEQADLQVQTRELRAKTPEQLIPPIYKIISPSADQPVNGLSLLPPSSKLDVYFDMEGFPLVDQGLEYLFGAACHDSIRAEDQTLEFKDWWAHDRDEEKIAFEGFVDFVYARWKKDPAMHIYHYADYERAAARRLASRHATRETEVDELLRGEVFVDLYKTVRKGLRIGESSYSIKSVELLYRSKRSGDVQNAGQSIVYYANWIESRQPRDWQKSALLEKIRDYNNDDCQSTHQLVQWLRNLQSKEKIPYIAPAPKVEKVVSEKVEERKLLRADLEKAMSAKLNQHPLPSEDRRITELFMQLLDFHWREAKPEWWRAFDWLEKNAEDREDDLNSLEGLALANSAPEQRDRSCIYTYKFDPDQDTKLRVGNSVKLHESTLPKAKVVELDTNTGMVKLKISIGELRKKLGGTMPTSTSILLHDTIRTSTIESAIHELAHGWATQGILPNALKRFLLRQGPAVASFSLGKSLMLAGETSSTAAHRIVFQMQRSTLCIQGPPGTGKTSTAAEIIAQLLKAGKRVGITSNSHKAIQNLLRATGKIMQGDLTGAYAGKSDDAAEKDNELKEVCPRLVVSKGSPEAVAAYSSGVIAGTAWLFARPEMKDKLDYLFVDEAGQVCLANFVAISKSAKNLVLMGDQMQLEQPVQGSHPGESGTSALVYYLQEHATIPESLGIFLGTSYRMHPGICRFISETSYENRLLAADENGNQKLALPVTEGQWIKRDAGIVFSPIEHDGNIQASDEEVVRIVAIAQELIGRNLTDKKGATRQLTLDDILFVAPYNMQVRKLEQKLPPNARVGSVDRFQGQEAAVVIISMCCSFGEYGSRGLEFLLDKNRINVAISRAQTLAIVVGDPRIATTEANNVAQMERINLFCRLRNSLN